MKRILYLVFSLNILFAFNLINVKSYKRATNNENIAVTEKKSNNNKSNLTNASYMAYFVNKKIDKKNIIASSNHFGENSHDNSLTIGLTVGVLSVMIFAGLASIIFGGVIKVCSKCKSAVSEFRESSRNLSKIFKSSRRTCCDVPENIVEINNHNNFPEDWKKILEKI